MQNDPLTSVAGDYITQLADQLQDLAESVQSAELGDVAAQNVIFAGTQIHRHFIEIRQLLGGFGREMTITH